jgi:hypothetical protein
MDHALFMGAKENARFVICKLLRFAKVHTYVHDTNPPKLSPLQYGINSLPDCGVGFKA